MRVLGLDTSNYTTSAAVFDGEGGSNAGKLLEVRPGERGLRQSEALFQHVKALPERMGELRQAGLLEGIAAVAASTRPRAVEGSYMPCFLAGESLGRSVAQILGVPFFSVSHQQGHLAAAAWSAGRMELLDAPFLAWHLSGGTTELLRVEPEGVNVRAERIGGTTDISAGQLIDRTGVLLGLDFPAGRELDELSARSQSGESFPVKAGGLEFSLSGVENQVKARVEKGEEPAPIARFVLNTVADTVRRVTVEAQDRFPGLPLLCSGGVASNSRLRYILTEFCQGIFAPAKYSTDNAMGVAVLAHRLMGGERRDRDE
ncbi:MAG: DNA-binding protein [Oscillospiraceae bacterium]|nr:DNA-binding protein [Oscillospiraceae bacterium]